MPSEKETMSVLIASTSPKAVEYFTELLADHQFSPIMSVPTAGEAKRMLVDTPVDILIINAPLSDDFGVQLALDVAEKGSTSVLLVVKSDVFEQVSYKVEEYGVLTLSKPISRQLAFQSIKLLIATRIKMKKLSDRATSLEEKMNEIRIVNHAKWILIDKLRMSEPEAHRYIEKRAMDTCRKKKDIAESIIKTYEN